MIPAASIEIAIGMKTISLNAVPQRTLSVSTANTRPSAVATAGATTTQTTLLRTAVRMPWSLKTVPKFFSPMKALPSASYRLRLTV